MDDSQTNSSTSESSRPKPDRRPKLSYDQFVEALKAAVAKPPKSGFRDVRRILNAGFVERDTGQFIVPVAEIVETYTSADRWAVSLAAADASGRLKKLQRDLLGEVRSHFAQRIGFYKLDLSGPSFRQQIDKWLLQESPGRGRLSPSQILDASTEKGESLAEGSAKTLPFDTWVRWAFVCLIAKAPPDRRTEAVLALMEFWSGAPRANSTGEHSEGDLFRFLSAVLGAEKPDSKKIVPLFGVLHLTRMQLAAVRDTELKLAGDLAAVREQLERKSEEVAALQEELADANATSQRRSADIDKHKQQLVEAENRYRLLDEHWIRSSATTVARKLGSLNEEVRHEVQEAILSLDRDVPNLSMALNRLRRLEAISNRQKGPEDAKKE